VLQVAEDVPPDQPYCLLYWSPFGIPVMVESSGCQIVFLALALDFLPLVFCHCLIFLVSIAFLSTGVSQRLFRIYIDKLILPFHMTFCAEGAGCCISVPGNVGC
jgi:hypothetical protein